MSSHVLLCALVGGLALALGGSGGSRAATSLEQQLHPIVALERGCHAGGGVEVTARGTEMDENGLAHITYRVTAGVDLARCEVTLEVSAGARVVRHSAPAGGSLRAGESVAGEALVRFPLRGEGRRVSVHAAHVFAVRAGAAPYAAVRSDDLLYGPQPVPELPARVRYGGVESTPMPVLRRGGLPR